MYWLKLDLREYLSQDVVLNSSLDSIEKPVFYANVLAAFKDLSKLDKSFVFKSMTFKRAYSLFLQEKVKPPRILISSQRLIFQNLSET